MGARLLWALAVIPLAWHGAWAGEAQPAPAAPAPAAPAPAAPEPAAPAPAAEVSTDAQFFAELGYKDVGLASDVARALVIFTSEGAESGADFEAGRAYLRTKGVLPDGWLDKARPEDPIDKGHLATLICRTLGVKGGLMMRLLGPVPRYALAECVYLELMARGADYCHVAGGELVGVIDRADRFRLAQAGKKPPELEGQPSGAAEEAP
jgi:hypothetical protein